MSAGTEGGCSGAGDIGAPVVAIVGGGCAGTLVASNLLRRFNGPLRIVMIERSGSFGPGVAYATQDPRHLLNVPAERMSAFCDAPLHFAEWAADTLGAGEPGSYLPRGAYGQYLRAVLADSRVRARGQRTLALVVGEVLGVHRTLTGVELQIADRPPYAFDRVVLATGALRGPAIAQLPHDPRVVSDPWAPGALDATVAGRLTVIIGTGLSGVDAALSLCAGRGRVLALSRGGRLPHVQLPGLRPPAPAPAVPRGPVELGALERMLAEHIRSMSRHGYDWRDAIDGLRPVTSQLWAALPLRQRRRFLHRRLRAWETRRHRMAPEVGVRLRELLDSERVQRCAGRVLAVRAGDAALELDVALAGSARVSTLRCARMVVCAGAGTDIHASGNQLLETLLDAGLASPDPLALGLRTTGEGILIDRRGHADPRLLTLGALRRGELWETTAVAEIRAQAERLVSTLEWSLSSSRIVLGRLEEDCCAPDFSTTLPPVSSSRPRSEILQ